MTNIIKIMCVVGARPNFMKIAPIIEAIEHFNKTQLSKDGISFDHILVHTGQHYDEKMSKLFFEELGIPRPDIDLGVGSGSHAVQTAEVMKRFEPVLLEERPDILLVVGDVNSTVACSLVASKIQYPVDPLASGEHRLRPVMVHVEAGLRSFDRDMPEEINRLLTDALSDLLFTTEEGAAANLQQEGIAPGKIFFVGNVMIDTLVKHRQRAAQSDILSRLGLTQHGYGVLTLHRPSNVDEKDIFQGILEALFEIGQELPFVFPVHPRTLNQITRFGFEKWFDWQTYNRLSPSAIAVDNKQPSPIRLIPPLGYLDFLNLTAYSRLVLTDSGGVQEETTILGVPCVTLRENTERPSTLSSGTNVLAGTRKENIIKAARERLQWARTTTNFPTPPLWDGKAAARIVDVLAGYSSEKEIWQE